MAKLTWAPRPTRISRFFRRIGLSIRGKGAWNRVHTRLFWKQPRMYAVSGPFSVYSQPYTQKKPRYPRGPQRSCIIGLKNLIWPWKFVKIVLKCKLRTWVNTWKKRLWIPPAGSPGICSWKSELQWVKVSNDFYFLLFIEKFSNIWKFLPPL